MCSPHTKSPKHSGVGVRRTLALPSHTPCSWGTRTVVLTAQTVAGSARECRAYIPQVAETNTPQALDVIEEPLLYDGFMAGILALANGIGMLKSRILVALRLRRTVCVRLRSRRNVHFFRNHFRRSMSWRITNPGSLLVKHAVIIG